MVKKVVPIILVIFITSIVFAEKVAILPEINKPQSIQLDDNRIYITDGSVIYIYTTKDSFKLLKKFGRQGEGPQEFRGGIGLYILQDHLQVNSLRKVSFFSKNGEFQKEVKLEKDFLELYPFDQKFVGLSPLGLSLYDNELNEVKQIYSLKKPIRPGIGKNSIDPITVLGPDGGFCGSPVSDGKFFYRDNKEIVVIYNNGTTAYSFPLKIDRVKVTGIDKQRYLTFFKTHPNTRAQFEALKKMFKFPEYFPLIRNQFITKNKIYIRTYKIEEGKSEFQIYNLEGKLLKQVFLPIAGIIAVDKNPYTIINNNFYQLIANDDDEVWELHVTKIE